MQLLTEPSPAPTSLSVVPTTEGSGDACWTTRHLQPQPTPLLDRTVEVERIQHLLLRANARLVTLAGPAGVGKTRLAREVGARLSGSFADGVVFVDLTPTRDERLVPARIAHCLGLANTGGEAVLEHLKEYLQERRVLLILDNFEHVLPAAVQVAELLGTLPSLTVMVTSRVPLRLRWEQTLRIPPFPVPDKDTTLTIDELVDIPSVALFVERAQSRRADFLPTEQQVEPLIHLIRQLDGLPLAIELAAANMSVLPLSVIARRMDRQLQILKWDAQDLPDRQRSLQAAIGWSYELLPPSEQRLFRHLGVFVGRVSLEAIDAIIGEGDAERTLHGLVELAHKSLVLPRAGEDDDTEPAFGMLETVRQYAAEHLQSQGEFDSAGRAHAHYFLELAERADLELQGRDQLVWYLRLESELDNLQAALRWLIDHDETTLALRMAGALGYFWWLRGYHTEGWRWLEETLQRAPDADPPIRIKALGRGGTLLMYGGDLKRSQLVLEEAVALARRHDLPSALLQPLAHLGLRAALAGDLTESLCLLREALNLARQLQEEHQASFTLAALGYRSLVAGNVEDAADHYTAAIAQFRARGNDASATVVQFSLAVTMHQLGKQDEAVQLLQDGFRTTLAFRNRWSLSHGLEAAVVLVEDHIDAELRARLLGALDTLNQTTGAKYGTLVRVSGQDAANQGDHPEQERLEMARRAGSSLPFPEVVGLALAVLDDFSGTLDPHETVAGKTVADSPLSPREQEVLRLVAQGLTSKQIGQQLFLSPRTVDHHLASVFNKLGVDSRAQAVAVAAREGLV